MPPTSAPPSQSRSLAGVCSGSRRPVWPTSNPLSLRAQVGHARPTCRPPADSTAWYLPEQRRRHCRPARSAGCRYPPAAGSSGLGERPSRLQVELARTAATGRRDRPGSCSTASWDVEPDAAALFAGVDAAAQVGEAGHGRDRCLRGLPAGGGARRPGRPRRKRQPAEIALDPVCGHVRILALPARREVAQHAARRDFRQQVPPGRVQRQPADEAGDGLQVEQAGLHLGTLRRPGRRRDEGFADGGRRQLQPVLGFHRKVAQADGMAQRAEASACHPDWRPALRWPISGHCACFRASGSRSGASRVQRPSSDRSAVKLATRAWSKSSQARTAPVPARTSTG